MDASHIPGCIENPLPKESQSQKPKSNQASSTLKVMSCSLILVRLGVLLICRLENRMVAWTVKVSAARLAASLVLQLTLFVSAAIWRSRKPQLDQKHHHRGRHGRCFRS